MIFSVCLLMTGIAGAQTVFSGKGIYISENGEMVINADKVILDSVKGSGTIKFGENTKEVVVSDKSALKNIKLDERQYLVKVKTSKDENAYYLVKNEVDEIKVKPTSTAIAKTVASVILVPTETMDSQKEKDATLTLTKVVRTFEKGNPMNGGVVVPNILSLTPAIQQDFIQIPNILYTTNKKSNLYGYANGYSFCTYADIMKPPIIA